RARPRPGRRARLPQADPGRPVRHPRRYREGGAVPGLRRRRVHDRRGRDHRRRAHARGHARHRGPRPAGHRGRRRRQLRGRAAAEFGGIDILMTAAGVLSFGSATETDPDAWNRVIGINLTGTFLAARAVIPAMAQRGGGAIITVSSSTGAHDASPGNVAYVASKGGVAMLTKAMAVDHAAQGVRVNAIAPGPTATPMLSSVMTEDEMR